MNGPCVLVHSGQEKPRLDRRMKGVGMKPRLRVGRRRAGLRENRLDIGQRFEPRRADIAQEAEPFRAFDHGPHRREPRQRRRSRAMRRVIASPCVCSRAGAGESQHLRSNRGEDGAGRNSCLTTNPSRSKAARSSSGSASASLWRRRSAMRSASRIRPTCSPARLRAGLPMIGLSRNDLAPVASAAT